MAANPSSPPADGNASPATAAAAPKSKGFKAWLPLLLNLLLMPAVAYVMTMYVLLPRMKTSPAAPGAAAEEHAEKSKDAHGKDAHGKDEAKEPPKAPPIKVLVNVSGTLGTRYLLVTMTLEGRGGGLDAAVLKKEAQLRDMASSALSSKTIVDLEKPGARNLIKAELLSIFNNVLGAGSVTEIYFSEFAIQ
jgi:flagellar FliL protein